MGGEQRETGEGRWEVGGGRGEREEGDGRGEMGEREADGRADVWIDGRADVSEG